MIVFPAIDISGGRVVRLKKGEMDDMTVFSDDPAAVAAQWIEQGAEWLHVVNLDGAFDRANDNLSILPEIAKQGARIQFGGGLRDADDIQRVRDLGVSRVVLGTMAAKDPDAVGQAVETQGAEAICVAMDARDGFVTTHGWTSQTELSPVQFGHLMREQGVLHALYTDVNRDGLLSGVNIRATVSLARNTGLQVIASGGVHRMVEIQELARTGVIAGVVIGMALYQNEIGLREALAAAKERDDNAG